MIPKLKGTRDYFENDSWKLQKTFSMLENIVKKYDFDKVYFPLIENSLLFSKVIDSDVDIVNKEMYSFNDKGNRLISLIPEGTTSVVRMIIENKLLNVKNSLNYYYISPIFRYERPQKGRQREFFQFGVEKFGENSKYEDFEIISIAIEILKKFEITKYELHINNIGSSKDRESYNLALKKFLFKNSDLLSDYSKEKLKDNNVFRIFDTKNEEDIIILKKSPRIQEYISEDSTKRFDSFLNLLKENNINFKINDRLVRGLDYYNDLVFEFISTDEEKIGSKSTIIGGGRYNSFVSKMDNNFDSPAIGFAIGIERLMLVAENFLNSIKKKNIDYYITCINDNEELKKDLLKVASIFRKKNFIIKTDFSNKKIAKKFLNAEKYNSKNIIMIGDEIRDGFVMVKNLSDKTQRKINIKEI